MDYLNVDKIRNMAEDAFNQAKPKTETEAKLYEVLSHKNWGSSSTLMNDIARETYDYDKFGIISTVMWESMEGQRPAAWRVVFKGLTLLEHLIKNGSERCVDDARNHGHSLRALQQFNYYEGTIDRGQGVREKSKQIMEMLSDDERVREERMKARKLREKFGGSKSVASNTGYRSGGGGGGYGNESSWESGGGGGGGGYGQGGIDSGRSQTDRYAGRYDNDRDTRSGSSSNAPTFASIPPASDSKLKKKKKKKKQAEEAAPQPAAPAADLLDFGGGAPAPAPAAASGGDDFDTLRSGMANATISDDPFAAAPASQSTDNFGSFDQAPTAAAGGDDFGDFGGAAAATPAPASTDQFGSFGGAAPAPTPQGQFDAFGAPQQQPNMMMGNGGMMMQQPPVMGNTTMMGGAMTAPAPAPPASAAEADDDFGDFSSAGKSGSSSGGGGGAATSSDPLSGLISLDGLSKNSKQDKKAAKLNQPIVANSAAASYQQEKSMINTNMQQGMQNHNTSALDNLNVGMQQQPMVAGSGGGMMMNGNQMGGGMMGNNMQGGAMGMQPMGNMQGGPMGGMGNNMQGGMGGGMNMMMNGGGMGGMQGGMNSGMQGGMGGGMPGGMMMNGNQMSMQPMGAMPGGQMGNMQQPGMMMNGNQMNMQQPMMNGQMGMQGGMQGGMGGMGANNAFQ